METPFKPGQSCAIGGSKNQFIVYNADPEDLPSKRRCTDEGQMPTLEPDAAGDTKLRETELELQQHKTAYRQLLLRPSPELKALKARVRELEAQLESKEDKLKDSEANNKALQASADFNYHENSYRNMEFSSLQKVLAETREDLAKAKAALGMSARLAFVLTSPSVHAENPERIQQKVDKVMRSLEAACRELENTASCV
ncbi:hypothetical protein BDP27DRAFT_1429541 [Rhodocollybia butyracea]|uniref:Uncharacterized protein n=1 Tax=Rhodocollybia butyracea TaxID=206335 RepID=A0A9P5U0U2_9AGAR|nr:hypothetical protein BDP27DRAFT_1429541 [Rhodocollybia butyracea]